VVGSLDCGAERLEFQLTAEPLFWIVDAEPRTTAQEDAAHHVLCDGCTCQDKNGLQHPKGCQLVVKIQFSDAALAQWGILPDERTPSDTTPTTMPATSSTLHLGHGAAANEQTDAATSTTAGAPALSPPF